MKKILITGANSYIGTSFEKYMAQWSEQYQVETVDMIDGTWREKNFSGYDCVYHVAGIAHIKETAENAHLYYKINRDLPLEVAAHAKKDGVKQFVFLSSMSVYGLEEGEITIDTQPSPKSNYGKSKLEAEEGLLPMRDNSFGIAVMRPPMVYGDDCKGNYQSLVKLAKTMPVFPDYKNQRSMIHIDRLSWFVKQLVDNQSDGLFFPQDESYVCTCKMVQQIAKDMGKDIKLLKVLNPMVYLLKAATTKGKKAFGNLYYNMTDIAWR